MPTGVYKHHSQQGFQKGCKFTLEHRKKLSIAKIGYKPTITKEGRKKLSKALKGRKIR